MTRVGLLAGAAVLMTMLVTAASASAAERQLVLEVVLNGRSTGRVGEFIDRDGALFARPSELRDLGFALASEVNDDPIPLSCLPHFGAQVDEARQTLVVTAADSALRPTEIGGEPSTRSGPLTRSGFGAVLNYDILGTFTDDATTGGALLDARVFGPYGVLEATGVANITSGRGREVFARLDTTYTFSDPANTRRWRVGDVVTGALAWNRAVRLGGVQVASDFSLRPDLVTYPLPTVSSSAAVPSTVNVLVNGIRQYSEPVQPGPFAIRTLPVVSGAGEVVVAVQDAVGRQTLLALPFYASTVLLKPGLASYSAELGTVRRDFGLATDGYSGWAMNGSLRYGLMDWLTLETHAEASDALALVGFGGAVRLGAIGVLNAAASVSRGRGAPTPGTGSADGGFVSLGFQRVSRAFSFSMSGSLASDGYRDLAAVNGAASPRSTLNASLSRQLGAYGTLGLAYVAQTTGPEISGPPRAERNRGRFEDSKVQLVTANYSVPVAKRFTVYATGFKDMHRSRSYGFGVGVSFLLGRSTSASVGGGRFKTAGGHRRRPDDRSGAARRSVWGRGELQGRSCMVSAADVAGWERPTHSDRIGRSDSGGGRPTNRLRRPSLRHGIGRDQPLGSRPARRRSLHRTVRLRADQG